MRERLLTLIQESAKAGSATDNDARKVGDFYSSFMDKAAIESKGIAPLKPELDSIAAIKDRRDLARVLGAQLRADVDALNNTNFETGNLFGVGSPKDSPIHRTAIPICSKAASACPIAIITSPPVPT